jgi:outer membrane protein
MLMMKKHCIALAVVLAATGAAAQSQTAEGPWLLRLRATHMNMHEDDGTGQGLTVNTKTIPELDISYFFNRNMAMELNLTAQERYTLSSGGTEIGTFRQLPTTLMWQYHFTDLEGYKPYLGIGINHTLFSNVNLGTLTLDHRSWGAALQAGVDIPLDRNWSVNLAVKKLYTKVDVGGSAAGTLKLDPVMAGVGIGYRY